MTKHLLLLLMMMMLLMMLMMMMALCCCSNGQGSCVVLQGVPHETDTQVLRVDGKVDREC